MQLYIHVPFCRQKCRYCAFHSWSLSGLFDVEGAIRHYVDTVLLEMAFWGERLPQAPISSIFFGGGTPSLLPPNVIAAILNRARRYFSVDSGAEISMEANPESLNSAARVREYMRIGINRLSLGVQSLNNEQLQTLGRLHTSQEGLAAYIAAREAGLENVNIDLMWGLPGQGVRQWKQDLKEIVRMRPAHLSVYGLTLEPDTLLEQDCRRGLSLPTEQHLSAMYMDGGDILEEAGYIHYEVSNYARMGFQCRHNIGYWEGADYLGFGPSATSTLSGKRWTNSSEHRAWSLAVRDGSMDVDAEILDIHSRVQELMMLRLRTSRGMRVKAYAELTGRDFLKDNQKLIHALHRNHLIRIQNGYVRLTRNGMLVSNSILSALFQNAERQEIMAAQKKNVLPE